METAVVLTHSHPKYDSGATRSHIELLHESAIDTYAVVPQGQDLEPHGGADAYTGVIEDSDGQGTPYEETVAELDAAYDRLLHGGGLDDSCLPRTMDAFDADAVVPELSFGVWEFNGDGYRLDERPDQMERLRDAERFHPYDAIEYTDLDSVINVDAATEAVVDDYLADGEYESALRVCSDLGDTARWDAVFGELEDAVHAGAQDSWPLTEDEYLRNVSSRLRPS